MSELPHFHDGYLTGLRLREEEATIYLRTVDGRDHELNLSGVEALQIEDFREGNIISYVEIVSGAAPYDGIDLSRLFVAPHPNAAAQYHDAHLTVLKRQIARIGSGDVSLVVIVSSYGADLLALCGEATCRAV